MTKKILNIPTGGQRSRDEQIPLNTELLNFKEARRYLNVSSSTLYKWCHKHKISYFKVNNKLTYFAKASLDSFLQNNHVPSYNEVEKEAINSLTKKYSKQ